MQSAYDDTKLLARICGCGFAVCGFLHYVLSSHCQQGLICQSSSSLLHFTVYMENKRLKKRSYACKTPSIVSKSSEPFSSSSHFFLQILRNAFVKNLLHYLCQKASYNKKKQDLWSLEVPSNHSVSISTGSVSSWFFVLAISIQ